MGKVIKNKMGLELAASRSSDYKHIQKNSSVCYILSEQV